MELTDEKDLQNNQFLRDSAKFPTQKPDLLIVQYLKYTFLNSVF